MKKCYFLVAALGCFAVHTSLIAEEVDSSAETAVTEEKKTETKKEDLSKSAPASKTVNKQDYKNTSFYSLGYVQESENCDLPQGLLPEVTESVIVEEAPVVEEEEVVAPVVSKAPVEKESDYFHNTFSATVGFGLSKSSKSKIKREASVAGKTLVIEDAEDEEDKVKDVRPADIKETVEAKGKSKFSPSLELAFNFAPSFASSHKVNVRPAVMLGAYVSHFGKHIKKGTITDGTAIIKPEGREIDLIKTGGLHYGLIAGAGVAFKRVRVLFLGACDMTSAKIKKPLYKGSDNGFDDPKNWKYASKSLVGYGIGGQLEAAMNKRFSAGVRFMSYQHKIKTSFKNTQVYGKLSSKLKSQLYMFFLTAHI